jgi:hypothetical protein
LGQASRPRPWAKSPAHYCSLFFKKIEFIFLI